MGSGKFVALRVGGVASQPGAPCEVDLRAICAAFTDPLELDGGQPKGAATASRRRERRRLARAAVLTLAESVGGFIWLASDRMGAFRVIAQVHRQGRLRGSNDRDA